MYNLVFFGPPGSGKGTHSSKVAEKFSLIHISTGDLLRDEIERETELGKQAKTKIEKGEFVPDEVVIGMIQNKLDAKKDAKGFIFDGFPRTTEQALALDKILEERSIDIAGVVALDVDEEELVQRILERGKISGRADDQDSAVIQNRIRVYHEKTAPVKDFYIKQGKVKDVNGTGCQIHEVFEKISNVLESIK